MAENKKSFVLYADYIDLFEELSDEEAGQLVKHIFRYVNDQNPESVNRIIKLSFEPIKKQLKRDLVAYEEIKRKRAEYGKIGGEKSAALRSKTKLPLTPLDTPQPNQPVTDTVNDTVTVTDTVINIDQFKSSQSDQELVYKFAKAIGKIKTFKEVLDHAPIHDAGLKLTKKGADYGTWIQYFKYYFENLKDGNKPASAQASYYKPLKFPPNE